MRRREYHQAKRDEQHFPSISYLLSNRAFALRAGREKDTTQAALQVLILAQEVSFLKSSNTGSTLSNPEKHFIATPL